MNVEEMHRKEDTGTTVFYLMASSNAPTVGLRRKHGIIAHSLFLSIHDPKTSDTSTCQG